MPTHIALLRGINVGGRNRLAMSDLRDVAESLGHSDVATYIQSGNLVFSAAGASSETDLAAALAEALSQKVGFSPPVVVVARDRLKQIVAANPFATVTDPKAVHVLFQQAPPGDDVAADTAGIQEAAIAKGSHDRVTVVSGVAIYLHTPDGLGRSDLAARLGRARGASSDATARNWATVAKLRDLLDA